MTGSTAAGRIRADVSSALDALRLADPDYYLLDQGGEPSNNRGAWRQASELTEPSTWAEIGPAYGIDVGASGRPASVVGGSCALQGYAWRVAAAAIGSWAISGAGLRLCHADLHIRMRHGRTNGLHVERVGGPTSATPAAIADDLVAHLTPIVAASRTVSRLRPAVAWGNVASAVASAWCRVHDSAPASARPALARAANECLDAAAWTWSDNSGEQAVAPLTWLHTTKHGQQVLMYRRHTCCLMRLSPDKGECASCSLFDDTEVLHRRWAAWTPPLPLPTLYGESGCR